ncbi:N,N-dimethylformamidase beta subunit family domain-containing protein [Streptomyces sp. NPDC102395]|uniref:N,N-dimethylformamidase beta subunit family domain-containing protein n=1 Tax=Streptomyces sp. NPDC102395 TaxID=3366168 RepID=UPI00382A7261
MGELSRRTVLSAAGAGAVAVGGSRPAAAAERARPPAAPRTGDNPVVRENRAPGSHGWTPGHGETCGVDPGRPEIQGYATTVSVAPGETLGLHLASRTARACKVEVYRLGHYGGVRARHLLTADGVPVDRPWRVTVPGAWVSGVFLTVLTTAEGHRAYAPFVVREPARPSDVLLVVPLDAAHRPYAGLGLPEDFGRDTSASRWLEEAGYDVTYATEGDLREGRVDPARYRAVVLPGGAGDVRWSRQARAVLDRTPRRLFLPKTSTLSEPGHADEEARRTAAERLDHLLTAPVSTPTG